MTGEITAGDILAELDRAVLCTRQALFNITDQSGEVYAQGCLDAIRGIRNYIRSDQFRRSIADRRKHQCPSR